MYNKIILTLLIAVAIFTMASCNLFPHAEIPSSPDYYNIDEFDFDIIIVGGQSNAYGYGHDLGAEPYNPVEPIYQYVQKEDKVCLETERKFHDDYNSARSFSHQFALRYAKDKLADDKKLLVINVAIGGTPIANLGINENGEESDTYKKTIQIINKFKVNANNQFAAFLWHQGESDVIDETQPTLFNTMLKSTFTGIQNAIGEPTPIVAADFTQAWREGNGKVYNPEKISNEIRDVISELNGKFIETDNIASLSDQIHFSKAGTIELGNLYYEAFLEF